MPRLPYTLVNFIPSIHVVYKLYRYVCMQSLPMTHGEEASTIETAPHGPGRPGRGCGSSVVRRDPPMEVANSLQS